MLRVKRSNQKASIMHTINLLGKVYIMQVDYETTLGPTVLKNIVIRNGKKHGHKKVSYEYLGSPTQADHNSRRSRYSPLFTILFRCFSCGKFQKALVTCIIQKPGHYIFLFPTEDQKRKPQKKEKLHPLLFNLT